MKYVLEQMNSFAIPLSEGKKALKEHNQLKIFRSGEGWVEVKIGSGNYHFVVDQGFKSN